MHICNALTHTLAAWNPDVNHVISIFSLVSVLSLFPFVSPCLNRVITGVRVCIVPADSVPIGWSVLCVGLIKHSFFIFPLPFHIPLSLSSSPVMHSGFINYSTVNGANKFI